MPTSQSRRAPARRQNNCFQNRFRRSILAIAAATLGAGAAHADVPLPTQALHAWEQHMIESGRETGEALTTLQDPSKRLAAQYYDAEWVFLRIAKFTGDKQPWSKYAKAAEETYKRYLRESHFQISGYQKFPHGLFIDWKLNGDQESRQYLLQMREQSTFSDPTRESADSWYEQERSREVAYSLQTEVLAAKVGAGDPQRRKLFADMALKHIEIWTTGNYVNQKESEQFCKPFMTGLTASALIAYYEYSVELGHPDERVPKAIRTLADWLWDQMWIANINGTGHGAFKYMAPPRESKGDSDPSPDLNLLIAPMYGWLYYHTGEDKYAERGDKIFASGVALSWLDVGKQFNQNYRYSFEYVMWRAAGNTGRQGHPIGPTVAWAPDAD